MLKYRIKANNEDMLELAETIRDNLQTELQYSEHDIIPRFKKNNIQKLNKLFLNNSLYWTGGYWRYLVPIISVYAKEQ